MTVTFGPRSRLTPFNSNSFTWANQGSASVTTYNDFTTLLAPANAGDSLRMLVQTAPATPYSITTLVSLTAGFASYYGCGLIFRDSVSGKIHFFGYGPDGTNINRINSYKYDSPTAFNAVYGSGVPLTYLTSPGFPLFFKIQDDGTNRICSVSFDCMNFVTLFTIGRTDYLTADQIGIAVNSNNSINAYGSIYHWFQGTS